MNTPSSFVAAGLAWERTRNLLFKPFDIGRWFIIGFSAWLATIGTSGGGGNGVDFSNLNDKNISSFAEFLQAFINEVHKFFNQPSGIGLIVAVVLFSLAFGILFCWLRSRGDFMFVHHLYHPNSTITECWQRAKQHADSLFRWRIGFFLVAGGLFAAECYLIWRDLLHPFMQAKFTWSPALLTPLFIHIAVFIIWVIAIQVMIIFLKDFVVPFMYWQNCSASEGWTHVLALCNEHPFSAIGYLLCMLLFAIAFLIAILLIGFCTCCLGFIVLFIPYIHAVALLPFSLFFRAYPIYFLSQWRSDLVPVPAEAALINIEIDIQPPPIPQIIA